MSATPKRRLRTAFFVYWFLLAYIIAALVWWFISLSQQNSQEAYYREQRLRVTVDSVSRPDQFRDNLSEIRKEESRNRTKYVAEGITFLLVTFLGAFFVYRSVRRQLRLQQQQQNFMMAVTHELKTPIAVARLNLETLQKHRLDESRQQKLIQMTLQETQRLHSLTTNILVASQLEGGAYKRSDEEMDLSQLTVSCIEDFRQRFAERTWEMEIEEEIGIDGDPLLLQIMINNLLENAHKYSPKGKPITVNLALAGNAALLHVKDQGSGIPEEEKKKIFGKFYRIGNEAVRTTRGTGLGLHLCRKIAQDHDADINVTNNLPSGSIFTITFHRIHIND